MRRARFPSRHPRVWVPCGRKQRRRLTGRRLLLRATLVGLLIVGLPVIAGAFVDPLWIAGFYDGGDGDELGIAAEHSVTSPDPPFLVNGLISTLQVPVMALSPDQLSRSVAQCRAPPTCTLSSPEFLDKSLFARRLRRARARCRNRQGPARH